MLFVVIGDLSDLINGLSVLVWIGVGLTFGAAIIMRITKREETQPYKAIIDACTAKSLT